MLIAFLKKHQCLVTTAESCTGGAIAKALTDQAGSSEWYDQGWVTYSAHAKHHQLGVDLNLLQGSMVSKEVAFAMAEGALARSQAQLSIAVTGVAGPTGGSLETPVGCCWFGFCFSSRPLQQLFLNPVAVDSVHSDQVHSDQVPIDLGAVGQHEFEKHLQHSLSSGAIQAYAVQPSPVHGQLQLAVRCHFPGDREAIRRAAVQFPFEFLPSLGRP